MSEDKVTLARIRAELVGRLATPIPPEERVRIQGELSLINAKIKALNTTTAAQLKAAADRRRVAGLAEAKANAERAVARANGGSITLEAGDDNAHDQDKTAALDAWIVAVLKRSRVKVHIASDGGLDLIDVPAKWVVVIDALCAGIHAAARGEDMPDIADGPITHYNLVWKSGKP